jgi:hypothetical protein
MDCSFVKSYKPDKKKTIGIIDLKEAGIAPRREMRVFNEHSAFSELLSCLI